MRHRGDAVVLPDPLERLVLSIVGQVISVKAAERVLAWRPYRSYAAKYLWLHHTTGADT